MFVCVHLLSAYEKIYGDPVIDFGNYAKQKPHESPL